MHLGSLEFCQPAMTACIYTKWRWVKEKILKTTWCDHVVTYLLTGWIRLPSTLKRNSPTNVKEIHGYRDCDMGCHLEFPTQFKDFPSQQVQKFDLLVGYPKHEWPELLVIITSHWSPHLIQLPVLHPSQISRSQSTCSVPLAVVWLAGIQPGIKGWQCKDPRHTCMCMYLNMNK